MDSTPTLSAAPFGISAPNASEHARYVRQRLISAHLHDGATWRIAPTPFRLSDSDLAFIQALGHHLLSFTKALNRLYYQSARQAEPAWVADYLDQGKPSDLIAFARMNRFHDLLPSIIRPDLILTDDGFAISELDSVPGGMGLTGCMTDAYADLGYPVIGGRHGMAQGFERMISALPMENTASLAIVVSEEAKDYRPEMTWLAARLRDAGLPTEGVAPDDVLFTEDGLQLAGLGRVSAVYRFFELFDLKNIPKIELLLYAAKKGRVALTPPVKPWLEEKMAFALIHHPALESYWMKGLSEETLTLLRRVMPKTWVLDPRPVPPSAIIPGLRAHERAVSNWQELFTAGQKERRFIVKPSGFSELAWGARGVSVGHDMSQKDWTATLEKALGSFQTVPYLLQEFRKGRHVNYHYHDAGRDEIVPMPGRVRLSPYYFVARDVPTLGGILATVCPLDKKLIHGMTEAIMAPCMVDHTAAPVSPGRET